MRVLLTFVVLGLVQTPTAEELSLEEVLSARQLRKYRGEDKYHDRIKILREDFEDTGRRLGPLTREADLAPAYRALHELEALSRFVGEESAREENAKELRHKEVKRLEIVVRKLLEELDDLKLVVSFREREPYEHTEQVLTELRTILLQQLFEGGLGTVGGGMSAAPFSAGWESSSLQTNRLEALTGLDRFTLEEFDKIRRHRKIVKRTEAFLEICRNRLDEIERRRANIAWDKEEPNPLELHTYADLLHAYVRALNSSMVNIDEKASQKDEEEKEIRKALEKLLEATREFGPRLEPLAELVRERRDEELGRKLRQAMKATSQAQKGAAFGLGAP